MREEIVQSFAFQVMADIAAAEGSMLTNVGHKLGLYRALAGAPGGMTSAELATATGTAERYVREWLGLQLASKYVTYDPGSGRYTLPEEHAAVLVHEGPLFLAPAFDVASAAWRAEDRMTEAFRTGAGVGWHEHDHRLFHATEAFFKNGYRAHLTSEWIPALDGVAARLERGGRIADVGCGHGASSILMAQAYPSARIFGFDYHAESIEVARVRAREAGVQDRVRFEVASATGFPGTGYDLVCFMDALHDMGDPLGAARHARRALGEQGKVMVVEPLAGDRPDENAHLIGRVFYAASTIFCTPNAVSQKGGHTLGAQAGPAALGGILREAGFTKVRTAAKTPFNLIFEASA